MSLGSAKLESVRSYSDQMEFKVFSVTKAISGGSFGIVAKSVRFEVWAKRHRRGDPGRRYYATVFTAFEVLTAEPSRQTRDVKLPDTCQSDLKRIISFLSSIHMDDKNDS
jgi:hypothetical protein